MLKTAGAPDDKKQNMNKKCRLLALMLCWGGFAFAQQTDPILMTINKKPITRSEFEYSYHKNNSQGVINKQTVGSYVDMFVNYQLKVIAAEEAHLDTLTSFKQEFAKYRDMQIRHTLITDADVENKARAIYRETQQRVDTAGGLVKPAHILIGLKQTATDQQRKIAAQRADSVYKVLLKGADFALLAKQLSADKGSAMQGGELPWIERGQTLKEFDDVVFSMKKGELHSPILSPAGYHIILLKDKSNFFPYDSLRNNILQFIEQQGLREQIISQKIKDIAKNKGKDATTESVLAQKCAEMMAKDSNLKYLIKEYHDGLLMFEMLERVVLNKAQNDKTALATYFRKNKKKYKWEEPRFKGIAYYTKNKKDIKAVKAAIKHVPFDEWNKVLATTFNNDSTLNILVEKGMFKVGDNAIVDKQIFKQHVEIQSKREYPYTATYGKKLKAPKTYQDVEGQVIADYQDELEKKWVEQLRQKYVVTINKEVLSTIK